MSGRGQGEKESQKLGQEIITRSGSFKQQPIWSIMVLLEQNKKKTPITFLDSSKKVSKSLTKNQSYRCVYSRNSSSSSFVLVSVRDEERAADVW